MNLAMFLPNWVGDVVMATPAIRAVRQHFTDARFVAVARPYVADVLRGSPWFDRVILCDKHVLPVARELRREKLDAAILFPNSFRSAMMAYLGRCRRRIGFARYGRSLLLTDRIAPKTNESGRIVPSPVIDEYNRLVVPLGVNDPGYRQELFTTPEDESAADSVWESAKLNGCEVIGLNPGAAFGAAKFWPVPHFVRLAQMLTDRRGSRIVVLCGPSERELAKQIVREAKRATVTSIADNPLSLGLTKAIVKRLDLLVTTDSGPRHFAAAFDRPVVTLYGPTHIAWTETYFAKAIHLQKAVPCGPCQLRTCPLDHRCMRDLLPDDVFDASTQLLIRYPSTIRGRYAG